ncbi:hypothetical protein [Tenacibaculum soleae]|uniref:hypothetical protein n=1 Tax=Tenacibaculum soleae TaxID=447689 RepID=UPI0023008A28|nr:hypothetical protein [Tenacibaculum soleae]
MIRQFKKFEIKREQQQKINGNGPIPNVDACTRSTILAANAGNWWAEIGKWMHC